MKSVDSDVASGASDWITGDAENPDDGATREGSPGDGGFSWLNPIKNKLQFSMYTFLQTRLAEIKDALLKLNTSLEPSTATQTRNGKQLGSTVSGLLHLVGPTDSGFYTNRLDPAGFFGGNGWFANKGGLLGSPGAIISTGSIFTDYPTPY